VVCSVPIPDPVAWQQYFWPHVQLYDKQREILYSVRDNEETVVPAGNGLGKDFISALCVLWFVGSRRPARAVTTSVKYDQLNDVLWGEIRRFLATAVHPLPFSYNHLHIRQIYNNGVPVPLCEIVGQVVNKGESLLGRHLPKDIWRTLAVFDEATGIDQEVYESSDTWAHCKLIIGNPYPCNNFFFQGVKGGDVYNPDGSCYRKVIKIKAEDSPNVRLGLAQEAAGKTPTNEILIPGLVDYATYKLRRRLWDKPRQCVGLDGEFYEGAEVLMFPPEWLNRAETLWASGQSRKALAIGCDPAEGGDSTCWSVIGWHGLIELISMKTPDTSIIPDITKSLMDKYDVLPGMVMFDRGGGGKPHADAMRRRGLNVLTAAFGEAATPPRRIGWKSTGQRNLDDETRYVYKNRRAELYGTLRMLLDPVNDGFGIPPESHGPQYKELRRQLSPIPLMFDGEGRMMLLPKRRKAGTKGPTLEELIGCSPDEADSLALAVFAMTRKPTRVKASVMA
jgi:hypothetical protein